MYSIETIKKATSNLRSLIAHYKTMKPQDIKMCISMGNKKIGRVMNVSIAPIITCKNCKECKFFCYDIKAIMAYPSCLDARARNTAILMMDREGFFACIDERISHSRRNSKFFRWHVSGDMIDTDYLDRMAKIARKHPDWTFWTYTKMYALVNVYVDDHGGSKDRAIPANLHIMFSKWDGMPMNNPHGFPVFACQMPEGQGKDPDPATYIKHKCPGNCDTCITGKRGCVVGESSFAGLH